MLGGFEELSPVDIAASEAFLSGLGFTPLQVGIEKRVLDNGAGIGRVVKDLFMSKNLFSRIDVSEPCTTFTAELRRIEGIGSVFEVPLQDLIPSANTYHLIWNQWVLLYLSDEDLVTFLVRCRTALLEGGILCAKENVIIDKRRQEAVDEEVCR